MMKILDYYYWVLYRDLDKLSFYSRYATANVTLTLATNFFSLEILFAHNYIEMSYLWLSYGISGILFGIFVCITYNLKREEKLKEKYKYESYKSRVRGRVWVYSYMIFSFVFLIWMLAQTVDRA